MRISLKPLFALVSLVCLSCSTAQPDWIKFVDAVEVPTASLEDRKFIIETIRKHAERHGYHLDGVAEWLEMENASDCHFGYTLWEDSDDRHPEMGSYCGTAASNRWIIFNRGYRPEISVLIRNNILSDFKERWPTMSKIPVLPTGGVPLPKDVVLSDDGYKINPDAASRYTNSAGS